MLEPRIPRRIAAACTVLWIAAALPAAAAEVTAWDQERVGELAARLSKQAAEAYDSVYRSQGTLGGLGSAQGRDFLKLKDGVRLVRSEARHLAKALGEGEGRDETFHAFGRLAELVREIREIGNRMYLDQFILAKFSAARETIEALLPYYDPAMLDGGPKPLTGG